jgi:hypothetical protein
MPTPRLLAQRSRGVPETSVPAARHKPGRSRPARHLDATPPLQMPSHQRPHDHRGHVHPPQQHQRRQQHVGSQAVTAAGPPGSKSNPPPMVTQPSPSPVAPCRSSPPRPGHAISPANRRDSIDSASPSTICVSVHLASSKRRPPRSLARDVPRRPSHLQDVHHPDADDRPSIASTDAMTTITPNVVSALYAPKRVAPDTSCSQPTEDSPSHSRAVM